MFGNVSNNRKQRQKHIFFKQKKLKNYLQIVQNTNTF